MKNRHIRRPKKNQKTRKGRHQLPKIVAQSAFNPDPPLVGAHEWPRRSPYHPANVARAEQERLEKKREEQAAAALIYQDVR